MSYHRFLPPVNWVGSYIGDVLVTTGMLENQININALLYRVFVSVMSACVVVYGYVACCIGLLRCSCGCVGLAEVTFEDSGAPYEVIVLYYVVYMYY